MGKDHLERRGGVPHEQRASGHERLDVGVGVGVGGESLVSFADKAGDLCRVWRKTLESIKLSAELRGLLVEYFAAFRPTVDGAQALAVETEDLRAVRECDDGHEGLHDSSERRVHDEAKVGVRGGER